MALNAAADRVTLNETAYEIGSGGFQKTQKTEPISGTEYKVYTAIGVAESAGKTETLTLSCDTDGKYYRKDSNGNTVEMLGKTTISDTDTNTYRTDSLTPVYVTEGDYTILTYTPTGGSELTIYEQNGTYYSKKERKHLHQPASGNGFVQGHQRQSVQARRSRNNGDYGLRQQDAGNRR